MGGSFALALKRRGLVGEVVGFSPSLTSVETALRLGVIDRAATTIAQAVAGADLVLVAVPVAASGAVFAELRESLADDALLMDVGSTKADVVQAARTALGQRLRQWVPAHPIAGKETAGVQHADDTLYLGRRVVLTPLDENPPELITLAARIWRSIGAEVVCMSPAAHDATMAAVSHLPHLIAFAYLDGLLHGNADKTVDDDATPPLAQTLALAGPGFRDFTRIAAGDAVMWRDILSANAAEVLRQSKQFRAALSRFETLIEQGDTAALQQAIQRAADTRGAWQLPGPPSPP